MFSVDNKRQTITMEANSIPSWSIWQVKSAEGAEAEITCNEPGVKDAFSTTSRIHMLEQVPERLDVPQLGTKQRRYSSVSEKGMNFEHFSQPTLGLNNSYSSNRTHSASSDSDLEKRRKLRKFKDVTTEISTETKRFLSTIKYKLLNRQSSKVTPVKQINLLPESDANNRWAFKQASASDKVNSERSNNICSYRTSPLHVPHDMDSENTYNESDAP